MNNRVRPVVLASSLSATMGVSGWFIQKEIDRVVFEMREIQNIHRSFERKLQEHEFRIENLEKYNADKENIAPCKIPK